MRSSIDPKEPDEVFIRLRRAHFSPHVRELSPCENFISISASSHYPLMKFSTWHH